jgi:hypothetical protein
MLDAAALIEKHRGKGVFVDANLLVLWLVGSINANRVATFKRTRDFNAEDFRILSRLMAYFGGPLVTTPHVLSQVSDLTDLAGSEGVRVRALLRNTVLEMVQGRYDAARYLVEHSLFARPGLGDASVAAVPWVTTQLTSTISGRWDGATEAGLQQMLL